MPAAAYGVLAVFTAASIAAGLLAWWLVGPRSPWAILLPIAATFGALYLSGHRLGLRIGPVVDLFGFDVALAFDLSLAVVVAFAAAFLQRLALLVRG
jgi:hypothetical protein